MEQLLNNVLGKCHEDVCIPTLDKVSDWQMKRLGTSPCRNPSFQILQWKNQTLPLWTLKELLFYEETKKRLFHWTTINSPKGWLTSPMNHFQIKHLWLITKLLHELVSMKNESSQRKHHFWFDDIVVFVVLGPRLLFSFVFCLTTLRNGILRKFNFCTHSGESFAIAFTTHMY